jgi:hypothetical protein
MSMRAVEFVENWASEHIAADKAESEGVTPLALATRCLQAANAAGIPRSEIEDTFDDLPAFLAGEIEEAKERETDGAAQDEEDE